MAENKFGVLNNVVLAYVKVAESTKKYQSEDLEYSIDAIVEKSVAKAWNKEFPKQKAKEFDAEDFKTKYKFDPPFGGDEVYVVKLKKAATKEGVVFDEKFRPRLLIDGQDGVRTDITTSRLCSNGVKAKVSYRVTENTFGIFAQLNNILVQEDDFVEYKSSKGNQGWEFGDAEVIVEPAQESATKARANKEAEKKAPKTAEQAPKTAEQASENDDDDSSPF